METNAARRKRVLLTLVLLPPLALVLTLALARAPSIETYGTIQRLLVAHDASPKVKLAKVLARPHAYAVGSLAELSGEITILDGTAWLALPPQTSHGAPRVLVSPTGDEQAGFLAVAYVEAPRWQKIILGEPLTSAGLDEALAKLAADRGLRGRDFPFRVDGRFETLTLAVVDGRRLAPGPASEEAFEKANLLERKTNVDGSLVGFYSTAGGSAFTHEDTHTHVHAVVPSRRATGHAQAFAVSRGAVLFVPAASPPP